MAAPPPYYSILNRTSPSQISGDNQPRHSRDFAVHRVRLWGVDVGTRRSTSHLQTREGLKRPSPIFITKKTIFEISKHAFCASLAMNIWSTLLCDRRMNKRDDHVINIVVWSSDAWEKFFRQTTFESRAADAADGDPISLYLSLDTNYLKICCYLFRLNWPSPLLLWAGLFL